MTGSALRRGGRRDLLTGALLGALAAVLLLDFGLTGLTGDSSAAVPILIGMCLGAVAGHYARLQPLLLLDSALIGVFLVIGLTPVMDRLSSGWVRADALPPKVDAIVVLSAVLHGDGALGLAGFERLTTGVGLVADGRSDRIVTTQIATVSPPLVTSDSEQGAWIHRTLPNARWDIIRTVHTTRDEAVGAAALLLPAGVREIAVVTSPMHTRRACAVFEKVGFRVVCVPAREHNMLTRKPETVEDRLATARAYLYERLGTLKYRRNGWIP